MERWMWQGRKNWKNRFTFDIGERFFTVRVVRHQNRSPKEAVDIPSLESFKTRHGGALKTWSSERCPYPSQGFGNRWSLMSLLTQTILWFQQLASDPPTQSVVKTCNLILTHQKNRATADFNEAGPEVNMKKLNLRDCIFQVMGKGINGLLRNLGAWFFTVHIKIVKPEASQMKQSCEFPLCITALSQWKKKRSGSL